MPDRTRTVILVFLGLAAVGAFLTAALRGILLEGSGDREDPYVEVQEIYLNGKLPEECEAISGAIEDLRVFFNRTDPVPPEQIHTITLPKRLLRPTIGDLATDRSIRLMQLREVLCGKTKNIQKQK